MTSFSLIPPGTSLASELSWIWQLRNPMSRLLFCPLSMAKDGMALRCLWCIKKWWMMVICPCWFCKNRATYPHSCSLHSFYTLSVIQSVYSSLAACTGQRECAVMVSVYLVEACDLSNEYNIIAVRAKQSRVTG